MPGPWDKYAAQGQLQTKPADPRIPLQFQQEQAQAAASQYAAPKAQIDLSRAQTDARVSAATAPADIRKAAADAVRAEVEANAARTNAELTGGAGVEQSKSAGFYNRALNADSAYGKLGVGAPSGGRTIAKAILPDDLVNYFTAPEQQQAEALQRDFIAATIRYESGAAIPPEELESQAKIYFPQPGDAPETLAVKQQLRMKALESLRLSAGPAGEKVGAPAELPQRTIAQGATVREDDPELSAAIDRMVRLGRPYNEANALVVSRGGSPIDRAAYNQAVQYARQNPDYKKSFGSATRERPTTLGEQIAGSSVGAYFSGAGNAISAGFNDELAGGLEALTGGNYEQGRDAFNAGKALVRDAHPVSNFLGEVSGSTLAMLAGGAGAAKLGATPLTAKGGVLGDAVYGGLYGAGENNRDRMTGAVLGFGGGAAGNIAGQGVAKTLGGVISPSGGSMRPLYDMGVRPSIGQRVGGVVNSAEEKLQSLPIVGDAIAGTRQRARDQYQIGLFNDALGEVGQQLPKEMRPGHEPYAFASKVAKDVYDHARRNLTAQADNDLGVDIGNLQQTVMGLREESQKVFDTVWKGSVARRFQGGVLSGDAYKDAVSELGKKVAQIRQSKSGDGELADALEQAIDALDGAARRHSSPEAVEALNRADRFYAKLVRLQNAGRAAGGDAATFSPKQYESAVKGSDTSARKNAFLSGDALNSDIASLGLRLGDVVPNSASFDRLAWAGGAGALGSIEPQTFTLLGTLGLLNAPGVRNVVTGAMAPRGGIEQRRVAEILRRISPVAGAAGSGAAIGLLPSN